MRGASALALAASLLSPCALAQASGLDEVAARGGVGRVGALAGWRWTPNAAFIARARELGVSASPSPGGPWLNGSFAYAPSQLFEVSIELFAGAERIAIAGARPLTSVTYGGAFAGRVRGSFGAGFWADEWVPSAGLLGGLSLVYASGGPVEFGGEGANSSWAFSLALAARFGGLWATLEARYLLPVYAPVVLASSASPIALDGGGAWVGLGLSWNVGGGTPGDRGPSLGFAARPPSARRVAARDGMGAARRVVLAPHNTPVPRSSEGDAGDRGDRFGAQKDVHGTGSQVGR